MVSIFMKYVSSFPNSQNKDSEEREQAKLSWQGICSNAFLYALLYTSLYFFSWDTTWTANHVQLADFSHPANINNLKIPLLWAKDPLRPGLGGFLDFLEI